MRITSDVLDLDPLLTLIVAARRAHPMRAFEVAALWARLQRRALRPIVRAPRPLLPLRCSAFGYRHASSSSVAELVLEGSQPLPPRVGGRLAPAEARVQVLATPRAQPAAVFAAQQESRGREHQLFAHRRGDVDHGRVPGQWIGIRIILGLGVLAEQRADVYCDR